MAASPHSMAFELISVERGSVGNEFWFTHDNATPLNELGTVVWVKFTVNSLIMMCRFVYVLAGEAIPTDTTCTIMNTSPWAAVSDQYTVVLGGNTATGGAGLIPICGVNSTTFTLSAAAYGWIQTHGPVLVGPTITGGAVAVVAQETMLNSPVKASKGECVVHTNAMTALPFGVVTTTESTATPAVQLNCLVF